MLVAAPKGDDGFDIYMIHAELFVPFLQANNIQLKKSDAVHTRPLPQTAKDRALVTVLYRMLNRSEQIDFIEPFLYPDEFNSATLENSHSASLSPLCAMVVECRTKDMPEFLAHKIMSRQYFRRKNLDTLPLNKLEAVSINLSVGQRFERKLEDEIGLPLAQWFKHEQHNLVVYANPSQPDKIIELLSGLTHELKTLHQSQPAWQHKLLVLVPFFTDELNVFSRHWRARKLLQQKSAYCTVTKPLAKIKKNHVHHFWKD
jgi:hypothetical protein